VGLSNGRESGLLLLGDTIIASRFRYLIGGRNFVLQRSGIRNGGIRGGCCGEKREDAAAEFFGGKAVGGGMKGARDDPELFGAAGGGVNHFRMAAGKRDVFFIANQKDGKRAGGDSFYR
jgi:hypothetical protein